MFCHFYVQSPKQQFAKLKRNERHDLKTRNSVEENNNSQRQYFIAFVFILIPFYANKLNSRLI